MNNPNTNQLAFFALLRAGLWEQEAQLSHWGEIDYSAVYSLAEEQSVVGLVAAGIEHVFDIKVPKEKALLFAGNAMQLEQRNTSMNQFIEELIGKLRAKDIYTLLIKGQGIAQCYERPLWRACGDIDLLLNQDNYEKAKSFFYPLASEIEEEDTRLKHLAFTISQWVIELHGTIHSGVSGRERKGLEIVKNDIFIYGGVRSWINGQTQVFLPNADNDVIIIFTHILEHFFYGGIGLRQICDWCRLLWTYRSDINLDLINKRIHGMGLLTEWKAFATLAVNTLGMPVEAMPLYSDDRKWERKAERILAIILETGNFGHNRDNSHYKKYSFLVYKAISFWRNTKDSIRHMMIFPMDATRVWFYRLVNGVEVVMKRK